MLFIFVLPMMQVVLFCLAIGRDPEDLELAIVNPEMNFTSRECLFNRTECSFENLSCRYLDFLNKERIEKVKIFDLIENIY